MASIQMTAMTEESYTETYAQRSLCAEEVLHTGAFTQRNVFTEEFLYTETFTQRSLYTEEFLHTKVFTHTEGFLTTKKMRRGVFTQGRL
jgi:hypothetical protein